LSESGIDKMLAEVRQDNKENDAEHMKPVSTNALKVLMEASTNYPFRRSDRFVHFAIVQYTPCTP
jgi:hypothetical protein